MSRAEGVRPVSTTVSAMTLTRVGPRIVLFGGHRCASIATNALWASFAVSDPAPAGLRLLDALPPHRRRDSHTGYPTFKAQTLAGHSRAQDRDEELVQARLRGRVIQEVLSRSN